jgi:hypothetical protein
MRFNRYLVGEHYIFYANFILVLLANNIVFLACHLNQDNKVIAEFSTIITISLD